MGRRKGKREADQSEKPEVPPVVPDVTTSEEHRELAIMLTPDEIRERGEDLAKRSIEKGGLEDNIASLKADYKQRIEALDLAAGKLVREISERRQWRQVACTRMMDYANGRVVVVRDDTGEEIENRPMDSMERQRELDFPDKPAAPRGAAETEEDAHDEKQDERDAAD